MKSLGCVILALLAAPGLARAQCIAGEATCSHDAYAPTTPTFHTSCDNPVMAIAVIDYDVPAGTLSLFYDEAMTVSLSLRDVFTVSGPAAGTPVPMRLRVRFGGTAGGYGPMFPAAGGLMRLSLLTPLPGELPAQKTYGAPPMSGWIPYADSLDLAFTRPAGAPFGLEIHADASQGYNFHNNVRFTFLDLPPGAQVTSCKGYAQEQPTPALVRSWGGVKAAYR